MLSFAVGAVSLIALRTSRSLARASLGAAEMYWSTSLAALFVGVKRGWNYFSFWAERRAAAKPRLKV